MADEKILDEELLEDIDLEEVAGGTAKETNYDMAFLDKVLKVVKPGFDSTVYGNTPGLRTYAMWEAVGVEFQENDGANEYWIDGHSISRKDAVRHARSIYKSMV